MCTAFVVCNDGAGIACDRPVWCSHSTHNYVAVIYVHTYMYVHTYNSIIHSFTVALNYITLYLHTAGLYSYIHSVEDHT